MYVCMYVVRVIFLTYRIYVCMFVRVYDLGYDFPNVSYFI